MQISSLLRIHPRFIRSVHLERDIKDPTSSLGYILTPVAQQALERICRFSRELYAKSLAYSWGLRIGENGLGLVLARVAEGSKDELPKDLRRFIVANTFLPSMATGDNEPLGVTVLRALGVKQDGRPRCPTTEEVLQAVRESVTKARRQRHAGVVLILDELGKNLEHAARSPEYEDVFLLQRLAEEAMRSGDKAFVIVALLHQGVAAYAAALIPQRNANGIR